MDHENRAATANTTRTPYATPKLVVYGALADITLAIGKKSNSDGGTVNNFKKSQP
ncbi:MAG: hypothetical protein P3A28_06395 [Gemmatimonadota bacterium]|nr:hypothetical protein [Gemmatimonadota bacterium]